VATRRRASQRSLTGSISDIQRRVKYLQNRQTPTRLGNQAVQRSAIQYRAVGTDQIAPNSIVNDQIQANAIAQAQLSDNSVGRNEIINGEVVEAKLGTDAVTSTKIKDGEVITGKLGSAAVELINMSPNSVANTQLTTDSVNFRTVDTNAIGNENMLDNSVGNAELQNDSVGNGELRNDSVGFSEMQSSSVGTSTLQTGAVTRSKIGSGQVGSTQIEDGAVTDAKIASSAVTTSKLSNSAVTTIKISDFSVNSSKLTSRAVTQPKLDTNVVNQLLGGVGAGLSLSRTASGAALVSVLFGGASSNVARGNHTHTTTVIGTQTSTPNVNPSTEKVKKNIEEYAPNNIKNLLNLNPKKYQYKRSMRNFHQDLNKEWMHGYLVEELVSLGFPEPVGYDSEGLPASLDYGLMSMLVLELVKTQQTEIDSLREEVLKLKDKE
jgi:hypothetical protein